MSALHAVLLGIVEGLTEFVPVSSTGHLIVVDRWLGHSGEAADAFEIVIQLGALLACVLYYRKVLLHMNARLAMSIAAAFVPTAIVGFLAHKKIEALLFGRPSAVAGAMIAGGAIMMAVDLWRRRRGPTRIEELAEVRMRHGVIVGLAQCASLWPGTSRSMATIVAGLLCGMPVRVAADFAFLVGIPTLGAACLFKLIHARRVLMHDIGGMPLLLGLGVSFIVGWIVIAAFLRYLRTTGLWPFGLYRFAVGAIILVTFMG